MSEETVETAARRVVRFLRIDDANHGGLLSRDTIKAADILSRELERAKRRAEAEQERAERAERAD